MCKWSYCRPQASAVKQTQQTRSNRGGLKLGQYDWHENYSQIQRLKPSFWNPSRNPSNLSCFVRFPLGWWFHSGGNLPLATTQPGKNVGSRLKRVLTSQGRRQKEQGRVVGQLVRHLRLWWKTDKGRGIKYDMMKCHVLVWSLNKRRRLEKRSSIWWAISSSEFVVPALCGQTLVGFSSKDSCSQAHWGRVVWLNDPCRSEVQGEAKVATFEGAKQKNFGDEGDAEF